MTPNIRAALAALTLIIAGATVPAFAQQYGSTSADANDVLPPDFRGRITYAGTHEGTLTTAALSARNLSIREILRSAAGGKQRHYAGTFNIELNFNGNSVSGRYWGTGGMNSGTVSGTRNGNRCRIVDGRDKSVTEATCTRSRYYAEIDSRSGRERVVSLLDAQATQFVDAKVEEQKQRVAQAQAAERSRVAKAEVGTAAVGKPAVAEDQKGNKTRVVATEPVVVAQTTAVSGSSKIRVMPPAPNVQNKPRATAAQARLAENALVSDSQAWTGYIYDAGSFSDPRVVDTDDNLLIIQANYTYNGGMRGWFKARIVNNQVNCIRFEEVDQCLAPRMSTAMKNKETARIAADEKCLVVAGRDSPTDTYLVKQGNELLGVQTRASERVVIHYRNSCNRAINVEDTCGFFAQNSKSSMPALSNRTFSGGSDACRLKVY